MGIVCQGGDEEPTDEAQQAVANVTQSSESAHFTPLPAVALLAPQEGPPAGLDHEMVGSRSCRQPDEGVGSAARTRQPP